MYRKDIYEMIEFKEKRGELDVPVSYAEMARRCGCDYRTVKSAIEKLKSGAGNPAPRPRKPSKLDPHADLIREKLDAGCKVSAIYHFLREKRGYDGGPTILKVFCKKHRDGRAAAAQIRFETVPGEQAQVDWKEDMVLKSRSGEAVRFSIFLMVLGYSRAKYVELTLDRSRRTLIRCMINAFSYFGGAPKEILFDNMRTVVDRSRSEFSKPAVNHEFAAFARECGFLPVVCRAYRPQTKGKVESLARMAERLRPYSGEFDGIDGLSAEVAAFRDAINSEASQATGRPPSEMLAEEGLRPIDAKSVSEAFLSPPESRKVGRDSLFSYAGASFSVPPRYIGQNVQIEAAEGRIIAYFGGKPVAEHKLPGGRVNWDPSHYREALKAGPMRDAPDSAIEATAARNLAAYDEIG